MFLLAFVLTLHEQTGALTQQVHKRRYLSIIIVAENGILDTSQITERTRPESFKVSCGTSAVGHASHLYAHRPYVETLSSVLCTAEKKMIREHESGVSSQLIDVEILTAHRIHPV